MHLATCTIGLMYTASFPIGLIHPSSWVIGQLYSASQLIGLICPASFLSDLIHPWNTFDCSHSRDCQVMNYTAAKLITTLHDEWVAISTVEIRKLQALQDKPPQGYHHLANIFTAYSLCLPLYIKVLITWPLCASFQIPLACLSSVSHPTDYVCLFVLFTFEHRKNRLVTPCRDNRESRGELSVGNG